MEPTGRLRLGVNIDHVATSTKRARFCLSTRCALRNCRSGRNGILRTFAKIVVTSLMQTLKT